jgi:pimeloyl-ACP methyl ester carboxylesterase
MADETITAFRIDVPQAQLDDLWARIDATRWPAEAPDADWVRGMPGGYLRDLVEYWRHTYDWRAAEQQLNAWPQFTTTIDGQHLHFVHARSPEPAARPLLLTHGWPGSIVEFVHVFGPLTDPGAHGGDPADAFHVVAPSIPGYGFSGRPSEPGWNITRVAQTFATLMQRLGYDRYGAQGGDWGSIISREVGVIDPAHVSGVHLNMLMTRPRRDDPIELTDDERERLAGYDTWVKEGAGYNRLQSTRPQTLAYALTDSPVGQLAWIVEKFKEWTDSTNVPEDAVDRDQMLTNVMIYWLTATAGSSAQLYYESAHNQPKPAPSNTPTGVAVFPHDIARPIRRLAEQTNNIVHWTEFERGGHFAAMEQPELLVADIRAFFRQLESLR